MLLKVFAGWFLHCKHTNIVLCGSVSNELACSSSAVTLLPTPQPDRGSDCQVDFWWATVEAATFTPGLMRLRAVWGVLGNSAVFGGVRTTAAGVGEGGQTGPLIFRRLLSSAHGRWLFLQLQLLLILFSWWIAKWNVSLLWAGRRWCIEDVSPSAVTRQAAFWLNDPLCIIWG